MSVLTLNAKLDRTDSSTPWGFRMQGGKDFNGPLQIQRVNPGSLADRCGVKANDTIIKIGNVSADGLRHKEAQNAIVSCGNNLELTLQRSGGGGGGGATPYMPYQAAYNTPQNYSSPGGSQPPTNQLQNMNISSTRSAPTRPQATVRTKPLEDITQSATYQMLRDNDPPRSRIETDDASNRGYSNPSSQSRTFRMLQNMIDSGEELPTPALANPAARAPPKEEEDRYTAVMHAQYNTPIGLYSADNALTSFKGQVKEVVGDSGAPSQNGDTKKVVPSETMKLIQQEEAAKERRRSSRNGDQYFHGSNDPNVQSRSFRYLQTSLEQGKEPPLSPKAPPTSQVYSIPPPETYTHPKVTSSPPTHTPAPPPATQPSPYAYTPSKSHEPTQVVEPQSSPPKDNSTYKYTPPTLQSQTQDIQDSLYKYMPSASQSYTPPLSQIHATPPAYAPPPDDDDDKVTAVMHAQYNTPIGLYSSDNAYSAFKGQVKDVIEPQGELNGGSEEPGPAKMPASETLRYVKEQESSPGQGNRDEQVFTGVGPASNPTHSRTFKVLQNQLSGGPGAGPPQQGYKPVAPAAAPSYAPRPAASAPPPWAGSSPAAPAAPKPASAAPPARPPAGGGGGKTKFGRVGDAKVHQEGGMAGRIPTCTGCGTTIREIRGPFVQALGKTWCPNHFVCGNAGCGNSLVDIGFVEEEGKLYCERDYEKYFAPRCHKCSSAVMGECVTAMAQQYHPHCFLCAHCRQPIGSGGFHIEEGQPYCLKDWGELFQTKCMGCEFAIEPGDRWVEALGGNWHSECFNCSQCQVNLEGQSFYAKGGKPYCKRHAGGF